MAIVQKRNAIRDPGLVDYIKPELDRSRELIPTPVGKDQRVKVVLAALVVLFVFVV